MGLRTVQMSLKVSQHTLHTH